MVQRGSSNFLHQIFLGVADLAGLRDGLIEIEGWLVGVAVSVELNGGLEACLVVVVEIESGLVAKSCLIELKGGLI